MSNYLATNTVQKQNIAWHIVCLIVKKSHEHSNHYFLDNKYKYKQTLAKRQAECYVIKYAKYDRKSNTILYAKGV